MITITNEPYTLHCQTCDNPASVELQLTRGNHSYTFCLCTDCLKQLADTATQALINNTPANL